MRVEYFVGVLLLVVGAVVCSDGDEKVLHIADPSTLPDLRPTTQSDPRSSSNSVWAGNGRSVNLSFFIPAFSLFALASQLMPSMFPNLSTATTSSRGRSSSSSHSNERSRIEENVKRGVLKGKRINGGVRRRLIKSS